MFKIKMMSGETYLVNDGEYKVIIESDKGIFIPRINVFINKSSISTAYPDSISDQVEDRRKQQVGILNNGKRVVKRFGEWVIAGDMVPDDNGNYQPVRPDPEYFPEVSGSGNVATEQEWERICDSGEDYYEVTGGKKELGWGTARRLLDEKNKLEEQNGNSN